MGRNGVREEEEEEDDHETKISRVGTRRKVFAFPSEAVEGKGREGGGGMAKVLLSRRSVCCPGFPTSAVRVVGSWKRLSRVGRK